MFDRFRFTVFIAFTALDNDLWMDKYLVKSQIP